VVFSQARRPKEEHVIEGFAAGFGGFKGDGELLFGLGLADELAKPTRAQFEFKTLLFISARGADEAFWSVIAGNGHAASSVAAGVAAATGGDAGLSWKTHYAATSL